MQGPGRSTQLISGAAMGDVGVEATLYFSGRPSTTPNIPTHPDVDVDSMRWRNPDRGAVLSQVCSVLTVGTITGSPRPPACSSLPPKYEYDVFLGEDVNGEKAGVWCMPRGDAGSEDSADSEAKLLVGRNCWHGVLCVRSRIGLRQCGIVRVVASNGWSSAQACLRTVESGANAVVGPIIGRVTPSSAVVVLEVDVRSVIRCVFTDAFSGDR